MIDAAGAIYVIGGVSYSSIYNYTFAYYQDVWVSTDGGAQAGLGRGWSAGTLGGYYRGTAGVLEGCSRGTMGPQMVPAGYLGGT